VAHTKALAAAAVAAVRMKAFAAAPLEVGPSMAFAATAAAAVRRKAFAAAPLEVGPSMASAQSSSYSEASLTVAYQPMALQTEVLQEHHAALVQTGSVFQICRRNQTQAVDKQHEVAEPSCVEEVPRWNFSWNDQERYRLLQLVVALADRPNEEATDLQRWEGDSSSDSQSLSVKMLSWWPAA